MSELELVLVVQAQVVMEPQTLVVEAAVVVLVVTAAQAKSSFVIYQQMPQASRLRQQAQRLAHLPPTHRMNTLNTTAQEL